MAATIFAQGMVGFDIPEPLGGHFVGRIEIRGNGPYEMATLEGEIRHMRKIPEDGQLTIHIEGSGDLFIYSWLVDLERREISAKCKASDGFLINKEWFF